MRSSRVLNQARNLKRALGSHFQYRLYQTQRIPIHEEIPGMPELKPARDLPLPAMQDTTLASGVRVCTLETYEQVSCIGIFVNAGSMQENGKNNGVSSIIEKLAFGGTHKRTGKNLAMMIEELGGNINPLLSRDMMMYQIEVLRDSVEEAVEIVTDAVQYPDISPQNVDMAKQMIQFQKEDMQYDAASTINEYLHEAAYGKSSPLGQPMLCPEHNLFTISADTVQQYMQEHYTPNNIVVAATSVDHEAFCEFVEKNLNNLAPNQPKHVPDMTYKGGYTFVEQKPMVKEVSATFVEAAAELAHAGLVFNVEGWHSDDLVPVCVLHTLLGGGSAFSAGGPGKGMYSRLYRDILNRYYFAECALSTAVMYPNTGLFGIYGSAEPNHISSLLGLCAEQLDMLAGTPPGEVELDRARKQLRSSMLMNLESRQIMCEDIGKQILMFGEVLAIDSLCAKIEAVSGEDISRVTKRMLGSTPAVAVFGSFPNTANQSPIEYENFKTYFERHR